MSKSKLLSIILFSASLLFADDKSDVVDVVKKHWSYQNEKNWKKFVSTLHPEGTMNGDSNGSFWYIQQSTVAAWTEGQLPSNKFNFNPRYIEVDVLEKGKTSLNIFSTPFKRA